MFYLRHYNSPLLETHLGLVKSRVCFVIVVNVMVLLLW